MKNITPNPSPVYIQFFYYYMIDGEVQILPNVREKQGKPQPYLGTVTTCDTGYLWRSHPEGIQGIAQSIKQIQKYLTNPKNYVKRKKLRTRKRNG